jgi:hypothetical protein
MDFAFTNEHQRLRVMAPMRPTMRSFAFVKRPG